MTVLFDKIKHVNIKEELQRRFQGSGDGRYIDLTFEELESYARKNGDYSRGGNEHGNFERVAAILALYPKLRLADPEVIALIYFLKQLDCVLWSTSEGYTAAVDSKGERYKDIYTYAKIARLINEAKGGQ